MPDRTLQSPPTPPAPDADVVAFLSETLAREGGPVRRYETHAALVLVGARTAYKVKRPVRFDYLDFSTRALREAACRRELEINAPNAPQIYLGVCRIARGPDGVLSIDGPGETVEWAVHMRAFQDGAVLSARIARGPLDPHLIAALARRIDEAHRRAEAHETPDAGARFAHLIARTADGLAALRTLRADTVEAYRTAADAHCARCAPILAHRGRSGFVRRCHGDLHLGNIVEIDGAPVLFDALEFDEDLATTDTLYDLAFLLMDLDHRGARPNANLLLSRYLWLSGADSDLDALAALPLFMAERAAVRALVTAQRAGQQPAATPAHTAALGAATAYLGRAITLLHDATPPLIVAVGGLSGTGKSTLAARIAPLLGRAPGALHMRSDLERKALAGVAETERLPPESYTPESAAAVYRRLEHRAGLALSAGHAVVVDAVYSLASEREAIEHVARRHGLAFIGLWLEAPAETLRARVSARRGDASDATPAVVDAQIARGAAAPGWHAIDASGSPDDTLRAASRHFPATPDPAPRT